jgi:4-amino-4-deoxy-L-arabinose transferase-like glycosyltransferase
MKPIKRRAWLMGVIALMIAAGVRVYQIDAQSIWFDEGWSAYAAGQPSFIDAWNADATNPPLYYALLHVAARFIGTSELALRFFSLAWGLIAIALAARLAALSFGRRAGVWALWTGALSSPLWWAAQEARMYTFMAALVVLAALAWTHLVRDGRPRRAWWLLLWTAELALLYTHNTGLVIAVWLNVVTLLAWLMRRRASQPAFGGWIAGQIVIAALWLPYFVTRFLALSEANSAITSAPTLTPAFAAHIWASLWIAPSIAARFTATPAYLVILAIPASLFAFAALARAGGRWIALHIVLLTAGVIAGLVILGNDFHPRYLVMVAPLIAVLLAGARPLWIRGAAIAACGALLIANLAAAPAFPHDDARRMVGEYDARLTAEDTVLAWSYADRYELAYYWTRLGVEARRVTLPEGMDWEAIHPLLPTDGGDIALNVWYTQRADYRGMMDCLLSAGTTARPLTAITAGMRSLFYDSPAIRAPEWTPTAWTFRDLNGDLARVEQIGVIRAGTADRPLCLPIQLTLARPVSVDLRAALIVRDVSGALIAQGSAILADAAQRTTSMQPDAVIRAFALVRLPAGTPPNDYAVYLRLYDERVQPTGYPPPSDGQIAYGYDLRVGTWTVMRGAAWDGAFDPSRARTINSGIALYEGTVSSGEMCSVRNGDTLHLDLIWYGAGTLPDVTLTTADGLPSRVPSAIRDHDLWTRERRAIPIPFDAPSGSAVLALPDGSAIARCQIESLPMLTTPPAFDQPIDARLTDAGTVIGWTLDADRRITLIWRADVRTDVSYTVFVQMLDGAGNVVAQSDALPNAGMRPTTTWREGEYIPDQHSLTPNLPTFSGEVTLIAGLYDGRTGTRVPLSDGTDHVVLATRVLVSWS